MDITKIDISRCDKIKLLQCLINNANCFGMNQTALIVSCLALDSISYTEAKTIWESAPLHYFDYCESRPLKVDLSGNTMDASLYVRDNGLDALEKALGQSHPDFFKPKNIAELPELKNEIKPCAKDCKLWALILINLELKRYKRANELRIPNCPATTCSCYKDCQRQR